MALPPPEKSTTCLVTGASSGIGAEIARELARRGHGVTLVARREELLEQLSKELHAEHKVRAETIAADLTDPDTRAALRQRITEKGLVVDVLVNNAGFSTTGPVYKADRDRELAMIRTDVEAVADLCTLWLPEMVERRRGAILNVASTAAFQPIPGQAGYGASKVFVLSYSQALVGELRGTGVTVTALCPGPVKTAFIDTAGFSHDEAEASLPKILWLSPERVARAAVEGMARGRPVVIPGLGNRVSALIAQHTPRELLVPILARQHPALKR